MIQHIGYRLAQTVLILFVLSFVVYGLLNLMPGNPEDFLISVDPHITKEDIARIKKQKGLDKPFVVRYGIWLNDVLHGDLGYSRVYYVETTKLLYDKVGNTLKLTLCSFALSLFIAIPLGIFSAVKQHSKIDYAVNFMAFVGVSIPTFWFALMAIYIFAEKLQWLPSSGMQTPGVDSLQDKLRHLILPVSVLSIINVASWVRFTRASMLEVIRMDYIRTAMAKGLDYESVILKHAFRNALIPIVTIIALNIPFLFSGAVITETVFGYPGMGRLIFESIMQKDYYVAVLAILIIAAITMLCNLLADILYAVIDPRIRVA